MAEAWDDERPHVERLTVTAAILAAALQNEGMRATLVGGGAVEFYVPGAYTTHDIDFVVEGRSRAAIDADSPHSAFAGRDGIGCGEACTSKFPMTI